MVLLVDFARVAIEGSPDVLLITDNEGILRWASPSVALLGYDPVVQMGTQVLDYVHPDDVGYALGMLTEAVRRPGQHSPPCSECCTATAVWSRSRPRSPTSTTGTGSRG